MSNSNSNSNMFDGVGVDYVGAAAQAAEYYAFLTNSANTGSLALTDQDIQGQGVLRNAMAFKTANELMNSAKNVTEVLKDTAKNIR